MKLTLRPTTQTDVWFVAENMRIADQIECGLSRPGQSVWHTLHESVKLTENPLTAVDPEGEPVAIFGCAFDHTRAYPWMLSTPYIRLFPRECLVLGRRITTDWADSAVERGIPMLCNWIHKENLSARRFVESLGFTILPAPTGDFDFFYAHV
jgi:hypothetical protein